MKPKEILIFAVPRSGATLIANITKEIFGNKNVRHIHSFSYVYDEIIIPIRDFRDCMVSWVVRKKRRQGKKIELGFFETIYSVFWIKRYINILNRYQKENKKNILWLSYERFRDDYDYIIDKLERKFDISVSKDKRESIKRRFNLKNVKRISEKVEKGTYDKETLVSKYHINKGETNYWKKVIPKYMWKPVYFLLRRDLLNYGYGSRLNNGDVSNEVKK